MTTRGLHRLTYRAQTEQAYWDWERLLDAAVILGFRDADEGDFYTDGLEAPPPGVGWKTIDEKYIKPLKVELGVATTRQAVDEANAYMLSLDPTWTGAISVEGLPK